LFSRRNGRRFGHRCLGSEREEGGGAPKERERGGFDREGGMEFQRRRERVRDIMSQRERERARAPPAKVLGGGIRNDFCSHTEGCILRGMSGEMEERNVCIYAFVVLEATRE
jgi:hypothetical protein